MECRKSEQGVLALWIYGEEDFRDKMRIGYDRTELEAVPKIGDYVFRLAS